MTGLVKKIDATKNLNSFVVYLSDDEKMEDTLKAYADKNEFKQTVLSIDNVAGPKAYKIAKDAEVTVVYYNSRKVAVNEAFKKGELNAKAVDKLVDQISKILD